MKPEYKPVIVVPAFRRADSLGKLLRSLNNAVYPAGNHRLIISLEGECSEAVHQTALEFDFKHGTKQIIQHKTRLGLKEHIYFCAAFADEFGSVIVLEDDLIVSSGYYFYAQKALEAYGTAASVAGISLYAQAFNETAQLPFVPLPTYDAAYFMRLASSWGVVWSKYHWQAYTQWKNRDVNHTESLSDLPLNIQNWPASSWKKEFNTYLAETKKYFSYPYISLASNSSHYGGEHMHEAGNLFEVPLLTSPGRPQIPPFPDVEKKEICYDMYMEAEGDMVTKLTGMSASEIEMDLYGTKPVSVLRKKKKMVTSKIPGHVLSRYAIHRIPLELNLAQPVPPGDKNAFFYECSSDEAPNLRKNRWHYSEMSTALGNNRILTRRFLFDNLLYFIKLKWNKLGW